MDSNLTKILRAVAVCACILLPAQLAQPAFNEQPNSVVSVPGTFGAICDGQHHYLSTIQAIPGHVTVGWTLAQWQAVYPTLPPGSNLNTTDIDGLAISAGAQAAVASLKPAHYIVSGKCIASTSINLTNSLREGIIYDFSGSSITSTVTGACAVDATYVAFTTIDQLTVIGGTFNAITGTYSNEPYCGVRFVRPFYQAVEGENTIVRLTTDGAFTHAAVESIASEDNNWIHPVIANRDQNGGMATVWDGFNHFNAAASQAVGANGLPFYPITLNVDTTYYSMTSNHIYGGRWFCQSCRAPLWVSGARQFSIENGYVVNNSTLANKAGTILYYQNGGFPNVNMTFQIHYEAYNGGVPSNPGFNGAMQNIFLVTGTWATPAIENLRYEDLSTWPYVSVIGTDTVGDGLYGTGTVPITNGNVYNLTLNLPSFAFSANTPPVTVFDDASLWTGSVDLTLELTNQWVNIGGPWTGKVCLTLRCTMIVPTKPLNANSDFIYDTMWEHGLVPASIASGTQISDEWSARTDLLTAPATFQNALDNFCASGVFGEQITVTNQQAISSTASFGIRSFLPGPVLNNVWASNFDPPLIVTIQLKANYNGVVSAFFMDSSGDNTYVAELTLPSTVNTCGQYTISIPQPPGGLTGWNLGDNIVGMYYGISADCGSAVKIAAGAWTATTARSAPCGSNTSHFVGTNGNVLNVDAFRITSSYIAQPLQPWTDAASTAENNRFFLKSVIHGIGTSDGTYQGVGTTGSEIFAVATSGNGTITQSGNVTFSSVMFGKSAPAIVTASTNSASTNAYDITGSKDCGPLTVSNASNRGFRWTVTPPTGVAANDNCAFNWTATASGWK